MPDDCALQCRVDLAAKGSYSRMALAAASPSPPDTYKQQLQQQQHIPSAPAGPPAGSSSQTCGSRGSCGRWGPARGGQAGRLVSRQAVGSDDQDGRDSKLPGQNHTQCRMRVDCLPLLPTCRAQLILTAPWSRRRPLEMSWPRPAARMGGAERCRVETMAQQNSTADKGNLPTLLLSVQTSTQQDAPAPLPNPPLWSTSVKRWKARTTRPSLVFTCRASKRKARMQSQLREAGIHAGWLPFQLDLGPICQLLLHKQPQPPAPHPQAHHALRVVRLSNERHKEGAVVIVAGARCRGCLLLVLLLRRQLRRGVDHQLLRLRLRSAGGHGARGCTRGPRCRGRGTQPRVGACSRVLHAVGAAWQRRRAGHRWLGARWCRQRGHAGRRAGSGRRVLQVRIVGRHLAGLDVVHLAGRALAVGVEKQDPLVAAHHKPLAAWWQGEQG